MIVKSYEVYCEWCRKYLGRYNAYAPTATQLRADGIKIVIINGKTRHFCQTCFMKFKEEQPR